MGGKRFPFVILWQDGPTTTIDPQYQCRPVKVAEHDGDASIRRQMGMRLIPGTAQIEIGNPRRRQHAEAVISFRGQIDPAIGGSSCRKENRLLADHLDMLFVQGFEKFGHEALVPKLVLWVQRY